MTELPSWVGTALEVLFHAIPDLVWFLSVALAVVFMGGTIVVLIWGAIFGRIPGERGAVEPPHPITRLVLGVIGLGLSWSFIGHWL